MWIGDFSPGRWFAAGHRMAKVISPGHLLVTRAARTVAVVGGDERSHEPYLSELEMLIKEALA